jgi:hypothetical protein
VVLEVKYGHRSFMLYNIYNPHGEINSPNNVLEALTKTKPKLHLPTVVAGNFNLHHPDWWLEENDPSPDADRLLDWATDNFLDLQVNGSRRTRLGEGGQRDSVLDLVFWHNALTATFSELEYREDLRLGSDHVCLTWSVDVNAEPLPQIETQEGYLLDPNKKDDWVKKLDTYLREHAAGPLHSCGDVDTAISHLFHSFDFATAKFMRCLLRTAKPICTINFLFFFFFFFLCTLSVFFLFSFTTLGS